MHLCMFCFYQFLVYYYFLLNQRLLEHFLEKTLSQIGYYFLTQNDKISQTSIHEITLSLSIIKLPESCLS